jgi:acetyl-CoA C-acetyltransferase
MDNRIVVVAAKRSPFGKFLGSLSEKEPLELAVEVGKATLEQAGIEADQVQQLFLGNCFSSAFKTPSVIGRQVSLGLGIKGYATTVDTACCSPLTALRMAFAGLRAGEFQCAMVAGIESMSRIPHLARGMRKGVKAGAVELVDPIYPIQYKGFAPVAVDAEKGAEKFGVSRGEMDRWALRSHHRWAHAHNDRRFRDEIVPVTVEDRRRTVILEYDEQPRPETSMPRLAALPGIFGTKSITAGNAPGLNDGVAMAVVMTAARAAELNLQPLAEIVACCGVTEAPDGISWVPAVAIQAVLKSTSTALQDIGLIEINEAFAAMPLISTRILADNNPDEWERLKEITNVNGGAVAIGHPVGASGLRILSTLIYQLRRQDGGLGVAAICGGLSQGEAVLVKVS